MDEIDSVVIGAGVVGLAVARELAQTGRSVVVLEATGRIGSVTSSRNSGVIHAGIYYPTGSLKAQLCREGRDRLYRYCESRHVNHARIGKHIVATAEDQVEALGRLYRQAHDNGVDDIEWRTAAELHEAEPEITAVAALFSPSTGIIDVHDYMNALLGDYEDAGGLIAYNAPFVAARPRRGGFEVEVGVADGYRLGCREIVNAGGLDASRIAQRIEGTLAADTPATWFARGCYFELTGQRSPFRGLVYPLPEPGGLGVHATLDLGGQVRFGPDVEWVDQVDYAVSPQRADAFYESVRRFWPGLRDGALQPGYAGIRPKLSPPGGAASDFIVRSRGDGVVDLLGIESPGLTSSLALADRVVASLDACGPSA